MHTTILLFVAFMTFVFLIYYLVPKKVRYIVILVSSFVFFAIVSKFMIIFLLATIFSVYLAGKMMNAVEDKFLLQKALLDKEERKALKKKNKSKKKRIMICALLFNLLLLLVLKYCNFFISIYSGFLSLFNINVEIPFLKIILPLGISYYTLSAISYLIDVCRCKYRGGSLSQVALFLAYFPQLLDGPIGSFDKLAPQLYEGSDFDSERVSSSFLLFLWGLFKKYIIADRLGLLVGEVFKNYSSYNGLIIVLGMIAFTFELYAEFSGLIDVTLGISEMFGFSLNKNFNQPFFSQSISEFWRRWHMSLGAFFREYVFYPISMSKLFIKLNKKMHGKIHPFFETFIPTAVALFAVWFLMGLWHGADVKYIVYGMYYFVLIIIEILFSPLFLKFIKKLGIRQENKILKLLKIAKTFVLINFGLLIFRASTLIDAYNMFLRIFSNGELKIIKSGVIDIYDFVIGIIGVAILILSDCLSEKKIFVRENITGLNFGIKTGLYFCVIFIIIIFGAYGFGYMNIDPIYGGF